MPVNSGTIASQTGAAGGLWTHTPVDWRGNETGSAAPGGWPTSASAAVPPSGSVSGALGQAPVITAVSITGITSGAAVANWTVQPSSASQVEYGLTTDYGSAAPLSPQTGAGARTTPISPLTATTLYHYRIRCTANNLTTYTNDATFSTV